MSDPEVPQGETPETADAPAMDAPPPAVDPAELDRLRKALREANAESAARRKRLAELEAAEAERQQAELSETERLRQELAAIRQQHDQATAELTRARTLSAAQRAAAANNLTFHPGAIEDALAAGWLAPDLNDKGEPVGVAEALRQLAKDRPYLIQLPAAPPTDATARGKADRQALDAQRRHDLAVRFRIPGVTTNK